MKSIVIGAHLRRDDIEPVATAIDAGMLFLSALEVADDQPLGDRDLLLRVAKLRAALLERATFVAIRYGFSAANPAEAIARCATHLTRWRSLLDTNRDNVEVTLKIAASGAQARPDRRHFTSGAEYLRAWHAATHTASIDDGFRAAVERLIVPETLRHRWIARDEKSLELVALTERSRFGDVRAGAEALRRECPGVPFLFSGPWPLEVFADDDQQ